MVLSGVLTLAAAVALAGGSPVAYVSAEGEDRLVAVQPITGQILARLRVPDGPHNVAASSDRHWVLVTSPPAGAVTIVDARTLRVVRTLRGLSGPHDVEVARDGRYAYVTEERAGRVLVLSLATGRIVRRVAVGPGPHDLAVSPDGTRVWVTRRAGLIVLDTSRPSRARVAGRLSARVGAPHDISFDRGRVWVTYWGSGRVSAHAPSTGRLLFTRQAGELTHHVVAANGRAWVTDHHGARAAVYDSAGRRIRTLRTCSDPHHVAVEAGVAVVVCVDGRLAAFREETGRRIRMLRVGEHLHGVALVFNP